MRFNTVSYTKNKRTIMGFLGVTEDIITFTKSAGKYDDGSTRSAYKQTFFERLFNKGAQKVVESVDSEKELFRIERSKIKNVNIMDVKPMKVAGNITYSTGITFDVDGENYMLGTSTYSEDELKKFKDVFAQ